MSDNQVAQTKTTKKSPSVVLKITLLAIIVIFALMVGFNFYKDKMTASYLANMPETAHPVTVETLEAKNWTPQLQASSTVRPNQGAMLKAQMPGMIAEILVTAGQNVKKGDLLVRLDTSVEQAQLEAMKAQLPTAKHTYLSYAKLFKTQSVSKKALDDAKAQYDSLMANVKALEATIERRQILAPFAGTVGIVKVNVGEFINAGTDIVRVEDRSQMKVDFGIAQNDLKKLALGQKVIAYSDSFPGVAFNATVTAIDPAVNASTGLIDVQATFDQTENEALMSGMFVRLNLQLTEETEQLIVPQIGISYNMYGNFIFILEPVSEADKNALNNHPMFASKEALKNGKVYRVKQMAVKVLDRQGALAQIDQTHFNFGDKMVVGGMQRLSNGSLVYVEDKALLGTTTPATSGNL